MAAQKDLNWFAYRRRRWLAAFILALALALAWAIASEDAPTVVVYNNSPRELGAVRIAVGATSLTLPPLGPEESAARTLPLRAGGELGLWLATAPAQRIAGPWVEPGETAQVVARVDEFGEVLFSSAPTWRTRLLGALR